MCDNTKFRVYNSIDSSHLIGDSPSAPTSTSCISNSTGSYVPNRPFFPDMGCDHEIVRAQKKVSQGTFKIMQRGHGPSSVV
jgi:hypothetical protein